MGPSVMFSSGDVSEEVELLEDHPDLHSVARQRPTLDRHGPRTATHHRRASRGG